MIEVANVTERQLLEVIRRHAGNSHPGVLVGIGDDSALLASTGNCNLLATTDVMTAGTHFIPHLTLAQATGYRAMAANISDIAAMGGIPLYALIGLSLPPATTIEYVDRLYAGLSECGNQYGVALVGGDLVRSDSLTISITVLGQIEQGRALLRSGARPGDLVAVTGELGGSAAGLEVLLNNWTGPEDEPARQRHLQPPARVAVGRALARHGGITACDDISDGLASELYEIALASNVGITLDLPRVPVDPAVLPIARRQQKDPYSYALYGGEDFELVFTLCPESVATVTGELARLLAIPITIIGQVAAPGTGVMIQVNGRPVPLAKGGFNHFSQAGQID